MTKCSEEFKKEALRLSDEIGNKKAAAQLGIPYYTLADWRKHSKHKLYASAVLDCFNGEVLALGTIQTSVFLWAQRRCLG